MSAENLKWWLPVYTKGIRQQRDPGGVGYATENPTPLSPEDEARRCDRRYFPALITMQTAWEGEKELSESGGSYEGPGYYLIGTDGVARKVWGPGDRTQRPGEDANAWKYRIGELQPEVEQVNPPGGMYPGRAGSAHATVQDVKRLDDKLDLILRKLDAKE